MPTQRPVPTRSTSIFRAPVGAGAANIPNGSNGTGNTNAFFGFNAGVNNTSRFANSLFGRQAGAANTQGFGNAFFGEQTGIANTTGNNNSVFGRLAGGANTTGSRNSLFGEEANSADGLTNATAIGSRAFVSQSNALVLGGINGFNSGTDTNVGIGTTAPTERLHVVGNGLFTGNMTVNGTLNATLPAGSSNYIQNSSSPQASSNFNISGTGTADILNATTRFNLGGLRVLSAAGSNNLFVGISAGTSNTGDDNAFFSSQAGSQNNTGFGNAFFGSYAGSQNTTGSQNAFFGASAGLVNFSGFHNAFFGNGAGSNNATGSHNAFFGWAAGLRNTNGSFNTFIGEGADFDFFSPTGDNNTLLGYNTNVHSGVSNGTAIGANASVTQSNSLILGSINGINTATADTKVGIGTTTPGAVLDVQRDGNTIPETARFTTYGFANEILGRASNGTRAAPTATPSGRILLQLGATGHDGTGFSTTPRATIQMFAADDWTSSTQGTFMRFNTTASGTTSTSTRMLIADDGNIGIGTTNPSDKLDVNGIIRVATLGAAGATPLCRNASNQIATCSSSLRYKTDITPFTGGLELVKRLRPIRFTWKQGGARDLGFGAEEVARVDPLLTFTNDKGEIEGVKYDRISVALVNAVKEQQMQIEQQQAQIKTQRTLNPAATDHRATAGSATRRTTSGDHKAAGRDRQLEAAGLRQPSARHCV